MKFWTEIEILNEYLNVEQKMKCLTKMAILINKRSFEQNGYFEQKKIKNWYFEQKKIKNWYFEQKLKFWTKLFKNSIRNEISVIFFVDNQNFYGEFEYSCTP